MLSSQNKQFLRDFVFSFAICFVIVLMTVELVKAIKLRYQNAKIQHLPSNTVIYTNLNSDPSVGFQQYHDVIVIHSNQIIPDSAIR